jgi:hypothetical protein
MNTLLRVTGVAKLISFYRYIYLDAPGVTRWMGVALILLVGLIHLVETPEYFGITLYLGALFAANVAGSVVAAVGIYRGSRNWGWLLGAVISGAALVAYLLSRTFGLPGFAEGAGAWDEPLGTVSMIVEALFIAAYFTVVTGMNVAYPDRRDWYD